MKTFLIVIFSFIVALFLQILPLPGWAQWVKPQWVLLVLIYWALVMPEQVGMITAFFVGLIMDLLTGTLIGEHALGFVVVIYFTVRFSGAIRLFPLWQQILTLFLFLFLFQTYHFWVWGLSNGTATDWLNGLYWLPCVVGALIWPWITSLLGGYEKGNRQAF